MSEQTNRVIPLTATVTLQPNDSQRLAVLCGPFDQNLKYIEKRLNVRIRNRANRFEISGVDQRVERSGVLLQSLYSETAESGELDSEVIHLHLQESGSMEAMEKSKVELVDESPESSASPGDLVLQTRRKVIKPRGGNQLGYVRSVLSHDINFSVGPAGTGKTYLAVAAAVQALEAQQVNRLLLVRPAVEAGEKLGFLPGDLAQKIDPYLRPLYDALFEMMGVERVNKYLERNTIEVAPLAYMRGRTLNNAYIILDEGQNTTLAQMKMFLTRIGFGSTAVITGDITQIDLPRGERSGLIHALEVLKGVEGISFTRFTSKDVVRHPLVQQIVDAYARAESSKSEKLRSGKTRSR